MRRVVQSHRILWEIVWSACFAFACSSSNAVSRNGGEGASNGYGGSSAGSGASSNAGGNSAAGANTGSGGVATSSGGANTGSGGVIGIAGSGGTAQLMLDGGGSSGSETLCDGVDNDGNGIIDDVDVGADGVCDCLRIATLGRLDTWAAKGYPSELLTTWLEQRSSTSAVHLGDTTVTRQLLDQYQIVVSMNIAYSGTSGGTPAVMHTYQPAEIAAIGDWIRAGGGFMATTGYGTQSENININNVLLPFDMQYNGKNINGLDVSDWTVHPITDGISLIHFKNGYGIQGIGGISLARLPPTNTVDVMRVQEVGTGRIVMWGDEWITYDTIWVNLTQYQLERFWLNIFKWLSPPTVCQVKIPPQIF